MKRDLAKIVSWGHDLLRDVLQPGNLAVDLTAGNGNDTLALFHLVGASGQVIAFDIQTAALAKTRSLLEQAGVLPRSFDAGKPLVCQAGVDLINDNHNRLACYVRTPVRGIIANLGYLPGGDQAIITQSDSTVYALRQAADLLAVDGRLVVVVYPGHPGGDTEAAAVSNFFTTLDASVFHVLLLQIANRPHAPFLYVAEKLK